MLGLSRDSVNGGTVLPPSTSLSLGLGKLGPLRLNGLDRHLGEWFLPLELGPSGGQSPSGLQ